MPPPWVDPVVCRIVRRWLQLDPGLGVVLESFLVHPRRRSDDSGRPRPDRTEPVDAIPVRHGEPGHCPERATDQKRVGELIARLDQPGSEFATAWRSSHVAQFAVCADHIVHPDVGSMRLDVEFLDIADTGQRMIVYGAADEISQQRFEMLVTTKR